MNALRLLRIAAFAVVLPLLFGLSQRITTARGQPPLEGLEWALGALSLLFLLRALATEYSQGPEANRQKDLQWGLAVGGILTIASQRWM
jgi:hypothetical protein